MKNKIQIGLLGFGTVGQAVAHLMNDNAPLIQQQVGATLHIAKICVRDAAKKREYAPAPLTTSWQEVVSDPQITFIVEVMGDTPDALEAMRAALSAGKSVVTANKAIIARHGPELFNLAQKNGCEFLFEASVAGSIPILRVLREGLAANRILKLRGIINGTCNYILDEMAQKGLGFAEVLKEAQRLGYAEADPTSDVEGHDARYKLAILAMLCYGKFIPVENIPCEGITKVTALDFAMAARFGYAIKLLGITRSDGLSVEARVHPAMVPKANPLAHVGGAFNAIQYRTDHAGEGMIYGKGAGGPETASAVVSDVMELTRNLHPHHKSLLSPIGFRLEGLTELSPRSLDEIEGHYYLRFTTHNHPGVLAQIAGELGKAGISISSVYQQETSDSLESASIVMFTHKTREAAVQKAVAAIKKTGVTSGDSQLIRIEDHD